MPDKTTLHMRPNQTMTGQTKLSKTKPSNAKTKSIQTSQTKPKQAKINQTELKNGNTNQGYKKSTFVSLHQVCQKKFDTKKSSFSMRKS